MAYETHFNCGGRAGYPGAAVRLPPGRGVWNHSGRRRGGSPGAVPVPSLRPGAAGPDAAQDRRLRGLRAHPPPVPGAHFDAHRPGRGGGAAPGIPAEH